MRLLVTGKTGQVVTALIERGAATGIDIVALGRPEFDMANAQAGMDAIAAAKPNAIVSAAAYTAVDRAESDEAAAEAVNATGPGVVAGIAAQLGVPVIHLSTDYVFDGSKPEPYVETDPTNPLGVYGRTKLGGEQELTAATPNHAILRTAWVYSPFGNNFLKTMLRVGADRPELRVVADQLGNPTSALDIADAVLQVARNLIEQPDNHELRGVFHMVGTGEASWADFATEIFAISKQLGGPSPNVSRITTDEYPTPARRPANSRLNASKLQNIHGVALPAWQTSTRATIARLLASTV
ncbi:dTDP-4-dehydrorhamnose reductase [Devosia sp. Leaf64]|uniref:dTDP-4-dehydrorhamnose reductase n=1 Tax=Devosia sp. Leaf64 TaxID=1736229 RepID=UPI0007160B57|nr:dTDP-4-dehydrorhamnose reductase [Devosia sp. Leaf64]KQN74784.1 dTDP-4-dehydrorhamnose reductase [Devosia sp. Leaf64]